MKIAHYLILVLAVLCSCKKHLPQNIAEEIIQLNPNQADEYINLSEIADSVECIRLKTVQGDLMGIVRQLIVRDRYIYAIDVTQQMVFVFDRKGEFVSKLNRRGRGPQEYLFMRSVFVDEDEEYLEVVNFQGRESYLNRYSIPSFDFIGRNPIAVVHENSTKRIGNTYYHATQQLENTIDGKKTNAGLIISRDAKIVKTLFEKSIETNNSSFIPNSKSMIINDENELFISLMYDDTFYKIEGDNASAAIHVDFGRHRMNNSVGMEPLDVQLQYIESTGNVAMFPVLNMNDSKVASFSYYFKESGDKRFFKNGDLRYYIHLKKANKIYHTKKVKNDITDFPLNIELNGYFPRCAHRIYYRDYWVDVFIPSDHLLSSDEYGSEKISIDGLGEITAEDNPIVILMKMKQ